MAPFQRLISERKLHGYQYDQFWCMDTFKEQQQLDRPLQLGLRAVGGVEGRAGGAPRTMMLPLAPGPPERRGYELLCLGAHSDDLEIGCAARCCGCCSELPVERITWVVLSR